MIEIGEDKYSMHKCCACVLRGQRVGSYSGCLHSALLPPHSYTVLYLPIFPLHTEAVLSIAKGVKQAEALAARKVGEAAKAKASGGKAKKKNASAESKSDAQGFLTNWRKAPSALERTAADLVDNLFVNAAPKLAATEGDAAARAAVLVRVSVRWAHVVACAFEVHVFCVCEQRTVNQELCAS